MNLTSVTSRATTGLVASVAGFASYLHITSVARRAGEHGDVAAVLPVSIDGLILVGTLAMLEDKRSGRRPRLSARIAVGFGVVATLAANIASAHPTMTARLVAAVPPIAFLIAVEVLSRRGRIAAPPAALASNEGSDQDEAVDPWTYSTPVADMAVQAPGEDEKGVATADTPGGKPRRPAPRSLTAAKRVTTAHTKEPGATNVRIAELAKVSVSTAKKYRPRNGQPSEAAPAETAPETVNGRVPDLVDV